MGTTSLLATLVWERQSRGNIETQGVRLALRRRKCALLRQVLILVREIVVVRYSARWTFIRRRGNSTSRLESRHMVWPVRMGRQVYTPGCRNIPNGSRKLVKGWGLFK